MFHRESWDFLGELFNNYGQMVKADAMFGVCFRQLSSRQGRAQEFCSEKCYLYSIPLLSTMSF